jgi:putative membrane-bound dehydrogenase-like protein
MLRRLTVSLGLLLAPVGGATPPEPPRHRVPEGFTLERAAGEPEVVFPMFAAFDERGRLFVAESSGLDLYAEISALTRRCRVNLLEDRDGDGRFERAQVFADQLVFPMGLAWRDSKLFVADPPDLVALEDRDGDGRADERKVLLSGFGHQDNGSLHGLVFGPDGWLYATTGTPDGYRLPVRPGEGIIEGRSGALLRCLPDCSRVEVVARGFVNLIEVEFLATGEVVGTLNWFQRPSAGLRDALVHLVPGGLYPLEVDDTGTPFPVTGEPLPAIAVFPAVALSGIVRYRGAGFPAAMRENLFTAQHNARAVGRHVLVRDGSSFRAESHEFLSSEDPDFHPSDVIEDADGSLLVVDTGGWYVQHCPTGRIRDSQAPGGIWRVRYGPAPSHSDPWGRRVALDDLEATDLAAAASAPFRAAAEHAVWALAALPHESALEALHAALRSPDAQLAALAARALARRLESLPAVDGDEVPPSAAARFELERLERDLPPLLARPEAWVRLAAAELLVASSRRHGLRAPAELWTEIARGPDPFLEHALTYAALVGAPPREVAAELRHPSPRVQEAALVCSSPPNRPLESADPDVVVEKLSSADAKLRKAALRILQRQPAWAEHAARQVEAWTERPDLAPDEEAGLRDLVAAFAGDPAVADRAAAAAQDRSGRVPVRRRVAVIEGLAGAVAAELPGAWTRVLRDAVHDPDAAVRVAAVRAAGILRLPALEESLRRLVESPGEPVELRLGALRGLGAARARVPGDLFEVLASRLRGEAEPLESLAAAETLAQAELDGPQAQRVLAAAREQPLVPPSVLLPVLRRALASGAEAVAAAEYLEAAVEGGWHPGGEVLDELVARFPDSARQRCAALREAAERRRASHAARLAELEPLLAGGDVAKGRQVFFGKKVACGSCHRVGAEGGAVGPDLTRVGAARSGRDLLESIVVPSSTFAQGYESYLAATSEGRVLSGVIARQSADTLVLRDSSGAEVRLRKDEVAELRRLPASLMPEGLERMLSREEFRDLLAFLVRLK